MNKMTLHHSAFFHWCFIMAASSDEHIIVCSICRRGLIVKDIVNNGVAFLSHLKLDHGITYATKRNAEDKQSLKSIKRQAYETI